MITRTLKLQTLNDLKPRGSKGNTSGLLRTRIFNPTFGGCPAVVSISLSCLAFPARVLPLEHSVQLGFSYEGWWSERVCHCAAYVYTGCTIGHFRGSFPPSCQILRFPLPEIKRWGE